MADASRFITCYHCGHHFQVHARAMSLPCPQCHKALTVEDLVVSGYTAVTRVQTCGKLIIKRKGRVAATTIETHDGVQVDGALAASKGVQSRGTVMLGAKAEWRGDCVAPTMVVKAGAVVLGGKWMIGDWSDAP